MSKTLILEAGDDIFAAAALAGRAVELRDLGAPREDDPDYLARHRRDFLYISERLEKLADQLDPKAMGQAIELARKARRSDDVLYQRRAHEGRAIEAQEARP